MMLERRRAVCLTDSSFPLQVFDGRLNVSLKGRQFVEQKN